jgi:predicted O-methyltransferase YrrM
MLLEKVGAHGRIVGIDASPEMVELARERVTRAGWRNITVMQSPVEDAQIAAPTTGPKHARSRSTSDDQQPDNRWINA